MKKSVSINQKKYALILAGTFVAFSQASSAKSPEDFGVRIQNQLTAHSESLFGIEKPLAVSAPPSTGPIRAENQPASANLLLAKGLKVEYLTRLASDNTDMMVFWPNDDQPTHIFTAVEIDPARTTSHGKAQPFVQRIDLTTGAVEIVLRGGLGGDPIRRTAWGTLVVGEELDAGGAVYEIIDPTNVTEALITDRTLGTVKKADGSTPETRVVIRPAMGIKAWEGIGLLASGVAYSGDELRPGDEGTDKDGGAIYKFVPDHMYTGNTTISNLADSPLASGRLFALTVSSREFAASGFPRYGQGSEVGVAAWVKVNPAIARADAAALGATGYYRPEDLEIDPTYSGEGVRFCWTNTQRESAKSYGEVLCAVDSKPDATGEKVQPGTSRFYLADAANAFATASVYRHIEGTLDFNSFDNLAFQPGTGNLFVVEDHANGDVWSCLPDGDDADLQSDGCVKVLSLTDSVAEPTGLFFSKNGKTAYLTIMHSNDTNMTEHNGWPTDDIVKITGFK